MQRADAKSKSFLHEPQTASFNFNKLQAVTCMVVSAALSISFIAWVLKSLL